MSTFWIMWLIVGAICGIAITVSLVKDNKQLTLGDILIGLLMCCGGLISVLFTAFAILEIDYCFYKFKK